MADVKNEQPKYLPPLRTGWGPFLALQWNAPLIFAFIYNWRIFLYIVSGNSFSWALGMFACAYFPGVRRLVFRTSDSISREAITRLVVAGVAFVVLGIFLIVMAQFQR